MHNKNIIGSVLVIGLMTSGAVWSNTQEAISAVIGDRVDMTDALPNAKAGQCFAKVLIPAKYETVTNKVMTKEGSSRIEVIPAKYQLVEEKVIIKAASEKIIVVPAVYKRVEEKVLVSPEKMVWRKGVRRGSDFAPASWVASALSSNVPGTAEAGQCFVEYHQAAAYKSVQEKMLKKEASARIEIVPAVYKWEDKQVLVGEASERIIDIPATYETQEEKILERAAYTTWKKGRGPIEKLNNSTGDIMCLIEVPAKYKIISKKVLKTPASTKRVSIPAKYKKVKVKTLVTAAREKRTEIPAEYQMLTKKVNVSDELVGWRAKGATGSGKLTGKVICRAKIDAKYKTISKQMIVTAAATKKVVIPAVDKIMKVNKLLSPAQEKRIDIPAVYSNVATRKKVTDEKLSWRQVLCETNTSPGVVTKLQQALAKVGFNPGPIDGVMGRQTYIAIDQFQKKNGLETGGLTLRTLEALNVSVR